MKSVMKILILCGVFLFMAFSCEKERADEYEDIPVQYAKCPCNHDTDFVKKISYENILLFDSMKITFIEINEIFKGEKEFSFILFSPKSKKARILSYAHNNDILYNNGIGSICNFPVEVFINRNIPGNGLIVSIEMDEYEACYSKPSVGLGTFYSDNIITTFKIKKR